MAAEGHRVHEVTVTDAELATVLSPYEPDSHIVLNWCEELLPGLSRCNAQMAACLDELGYTYTVSPSDVRSLSWNKAVT